MLLPEKTSESDMAPQKIIDTYCCPTEQSGRQDISVRTGGLSMPEEHRKSDEMLKVLIKSRWAVIRLEGDGRDIALGALGCLTALGALFLYLLFLS
jgi:hypothetical protein